MKIIEESNLISLIIFEGDIQDRNYYYQYKIYKKFLLMTLDTMGFELRNPFQHLFLLDIPKFGIQN